MQPVLNYKIQFFVYGLASGRAITLGLHCPVAMSFDRCSSCAIVCERFSWPDHVVSHSYVALVCMSVVLSRSSSEKLDGH